MKQREILTFAIGLVIGLAAGWWLQEQNLIDACIDAGGRWERNGSYCEGLTP